jgi:hypothetical protein
MKRGNPEVGDCFEIDLHDGRFAYAQYLYWHKLYGSLIQVFDLVTSERVVIERLASARPMFRPVFAGLKAAITKGGWRLLGNLPVEGFVFPTFRYTHSTQPGAHHDWHLWNGDAYISVGALSPEQRSFELLCGWGYPSLEDRIANGGRSPRADLMT